jgi:hypothetical protein
VVTKDLGKEVRKVRRGAQGIVGEAKLFCMIL